MARGTKGVVSRITRGSGQSTREHAYRSAGYGSTTGTLRTVPRNIFSSFNGAVRNVSTRLGRSRWQVFGIPLSIASVSVVGYAAYYFLL